MSRLENIREVADYLFNQGKYREAFTVYDELYRQIWSFLGSVPKLEVNYSRNKFNIFGRSGNNLYQQSLELAVNSSCLKMYNINVSIFINEFIRVLYGRLQCLSYCSELIEEVVHENILVEFLVMYIIIGQPFNQRKITSVYDIVNIEVDEDNRLIKINSNYPKVVVDKYIIENVSRVRYSEWNKVNNLLIEYLVNTNKPNKYLLDKVSALVGYNQYRSFQQRHYSTEFKSKEHYESFERYERYERFERYEKYNGSNRNVSEAASEEEKKFYYGQLIGLKGKMTKSQIRSKYISLISMYHPDKVQHLGPELRELAESKTKEINVAYDWLKVRYCL